MDRRSFILSTMLTGTVVIGLSRQGYAASNDILRVGYLHGLHSSGHLWAGLAIDAWQKQGIELQLTRFITGLEAYQALSGNSVDLVTTGAVISNFPARGQGKAFIINALEKGSAQIWADPAQGIHSLKDLKGKKISTTRGTTADVFLHAALKSVGLDSRADVEIVHQRMDQAVTTFIAGSVPATCLWLPYDLEVKKRRPNSKLIAHAIDFPEATIVDGWSARNSLYQTNPDLLKRFIKGWGEANDFLVKDNANALEILANKYFKELGLTELKREFKFAQWYSTQNWLPFYQDGSIYQWLNKVTNFNKEVGGIIDPIWAETYFDPQLFLSVFKKT